MFYSSRMETLRWVFPQKLLHVTSSSDHSPFDIAEFSKTSKDFIFARAISPILDLL